jgi:hypothetical protein
MLSVSAAGAHEPYMNSVSIALPRCCHGLRSLYFSGTYHEWLQSQHASQADPGDSKHTVQDDRPARQAGCAALGSKSDARNTSRRRAPQHASLCTAAARGQKICTRCRWQRCGYRWHPTSSAQAKLGGTAGDVNQARQRQRSRCNVLPNKHVT